MTIETDPANGKFCCLLHSDNKYYIRIYDSVKHTCRDYDIRHSDLWFTIKDNDAYLYSDGNQHWIDHSPETLGISNETQVEE